MGEKDLRAVEAGNQKLNNVAQLPNNVVVQNAKEVSIGAGTQIWDHSKLIGPCTIGENCRIGMNCTVEPHVTIGDNVKIQNNVSVYSGVVLEDDVFVGPSAVFTNIPVPRSAYPNKNYLSTVVRRGASIGANATIVCGREIGKCAMIGAGSVVTKDVPPHALVYGNPAKIHGYVCACGNRLYFHTPHTADCLVCGNCYHRDLMEIGDCHNVGPQS